MTDQGPHGNPEQDLGWEDLAGGERGGMHPFAFGEDSAEVVVKCFSDGQRVVSGRRIVTGTDPRLRSLHRAMVIVPTLACGCSPASEDDAVRCLLPDCRRVVCVRRHSTTCQRCGRVCCHLCWVRVRLGGRQVFDVCCECFDELATTRLRKLARWLKKCVIALWQYGLRRYRHARARTRLPQRPR